MIRPVTAFVFLLLLGLALGGCTKCGWIWQDSGRVCHSDAPR